MANAEFTRRYGVPAPGAPKGNYPVTSSDMIQGGLHEVANETEMTKILPQFRRLGMEVNVLSTKKKYRLMTNPDTEYTVLSDWKYIPDAISNEELNKLVTDSELDSVILKLQNNLKNNYASKDYLNQKYLTAEKMAKYYQSIDGMKNYLTTENLQNVIVTLSKTVSRVLPLDVIRVSQGTPIAAITLPTSVVVYYQDSSYNIVPVNWNWQVYDEELVGYQTIEGKIFLPDYVDISVNPNVQRVQQVIQVIARDEEIIEAIRYSDIAGYEELDTILVDIGTEVRSLKLPSQVSVKLVNEEGVTSFKTMDIMWDYSQFDYDNLNHGVEIPGDIIILEDDHITNLLKIRPKVVVKTMSTNIPPTYQYKRAAILDAGTAHIESDVVNRINHVYTQDFYGCGNDVSQRIVDIRFMGLLNKNGVNITPQITDKYPEGIRMPVLTSSDEDVQSFLDVIKSFNKDLGYHLEYEIPGGPYNPRVLLDDETHRISFGSAPMHSCSFIIRRSSTVNLPYPDIC